MSSHLKPREVDGKNTSLTGQIARMDPAMVRFDGPSAERKAKTEASMTVLRFGQSEELVEVPRETAAFVVDLDEYSLGAGVDFQHDGGMTPGELERVLQQVSYRRSQHLSIGLDRDSILDGHDDQSEAVGVCIQCCGRRDVSDQFVNQESFRVLDGLAETDLGERATNERP